MRRALSIMRQLGLDPVKTIRSVRGLGRYFFDLLRFVQQSKKLNVAKQLNLSPALQDFHASSSSADGHYFWQDLICARWVHDSEPITHFDVGSRVDGFIAHLLAFREVMQLDIRKPEIPIPGLTTVLGDAQLELQGFVERFQSVSSLHSIEHFGLGRYSDSIDPNGHIAGIQNIANTVMPGGTLYLSFPIGKEQVQFNEQRIVDPLLPIQLLPNFLLEDFVVIPWKGAPIYGLSPFQVDLSVLGQAGLYRFRKN